MNNSSVQQIIEELINAAAPFLSDDVVDETTGTIPLMIRLEKAIKQMKIELKKGGLK